MAARSRAMLAMNPRIVKLALGPDLMGRLHRVVEFDPSLNASESAEPGVRRALADTEILVSGWGCPPIDGEILALAPRLRAIVHAAGTIRGHVTQACWERGIVVSSSAAANALPVAEYTVAMILLSNKRVFDMARVHRERRARLDWNELYPDAGNYRKTVGILGASLVGRRVIELLRPYDLDVTLSDPYVSASEATDLGVRRVTIEELFRGSDLISLHAPLLPQTRDIVGRTLLASMRDGSTLINTARGALVDQAALTDELCSGRIHAVLDVTDPDPLPADSPLFECDNVIVTPHIAGSQGGEVRRLISSAIDEVERFVRGEEFRHPVRREDLSRLA